MFKQDKLNVKNNFFSFCVFPESLLRNIFSYLPARDLLTIQQVEKIKKAKPEENEKFWNSVKEKALKSKYPRYASLINKYLMQGHCINHIARAIVGYGDEITEKKLSLFLNLLSSPQNLSEQQFAELSQFIVHLPERSLISYLKQKGHHQTLDLLFKKYSNQVLQAIRNYKCEDLQFSPSQLYCLTICQTIGIDNFEFLKSQLKDEGHFILQILEIALDEKLDGLIYIGLSYLTHFIEFNRKDYFEKGIELVRKHLPYLLTLKADHFDYLYSLQKVLELSETRSEKTNRWLSVQYKKWVIATVQYQQSSFFDFSQIQKEIDPELNASFYFEMLALNIIHGNVTEIQSLLEIIKQQNIKIPISDLVVFAAFTKRDFFQVFALLEKIGLIFNPCQTYSIQNASLFEFLNYKDGDVLKDIFKRRNTLIEWAVIGQNISLLTKLLKNNFVISNSIITDQEFVIRKSLQLALRLKAFSVAQYLTKACDYSDIPLNVSLYLNDFSMFVEKLQKIDHSEINGEYLFKNIFERRTMLYEAMQINYQFAPMEFSSTKIAFMLLAKGANPDIYCGKIGRQSTAVDELIVNVSITSNDTKFINFMFKHRLVLFSSNSLKQKIVNVVSDELYTNASQSEKNPDFNEFIKASASIDQKIENFVDYISRQLVEADCDAPKLIQHLSNIANYVRNKCIAEILNHLMAFLKLDHELQPLLEAGMASKLKI